MVVLSRRRSVIVRNFDTRAFCITNRNDKKIFSFPNTLPALKNVIERTDTVPTLTFYAYTYVTYFHSTKPIISYQRIIMFSNFTTTMTTNTSLIFCTQNATRFCDIGTVVDIASHKYFL